MPLSTKRVLTLVLMGLMILSVSLFAQPQLPPGEEPPPTMFDRLDKAGDDIDGADYAIVYDHAVNRVKETGVTYVDHTILYKVFTEQGCKDLSVLRWNYDPQSSFVTVKEVNILRDGQKIPVLVSDVQDLPAPQSAIYWSDRIKILQLPRLEVGDGIEVIEFRKGFTYALLAKGEGAAGGAPDDNRYIPPDSGQYFDIVLFEADVPIVYKKYVLTLVNGKLAHSKVYNGGLYSSTSYTADSTIYAWWAENMPAIKHEPRQPDASDFTPKVVIATSESWEAKSKWFFHANDKQFEATPEIQAKVDEIIAGLPKKASDEEKARALVHWVAQNIRYSGQTMGEGEGFTLHPGEMIFEQRSGVCKDIAGMLITFFRAAGFESNPAMTMAGSRIETVPADQFNHCVTALRVGDEWVMYDPTWVPYNNDIWSKLETEQQYLVGSPEGEPLRTIAYSPPEESRLGIKSTGKILADGTLEGHFRMDGKGALDSRLRRVVNRTRKAELNLSLSRLLGHIGYQIEGLTYKFRPADNFDGDMWLEIDYRIPNFAAVIDGGLEFISPMAQITKNNGILFRGGSVDWAEERSTDVMLYHTQLIDGKEELTLPKGYSMATLPASDEVDETYGYFKGTSEAKKNKLTINQHVEVRRRQIPPSGYAGFAKAMNEARNWPATVYRAEGGAK